MITPCIVLNINIIIALVIVGIVVLFTTVPETLKSGFQMTRDETLTKHFKIICIGLITLSFLAVVSLIYAVVMIGV